jgi:hypothetical protein
MSIEAPFRIPSDDDRRRSLAAAGRAADELRAAQRARIVMVRNAIHNGATVAEVADAAGLAPADVETIVGPAADVEAAIAAERRARARQVLGRALERLERAQYEMAAARQFAIDMAVDPDESVPDGLGGASNG